MADIYDLLLTGGLEDPGRMSAMAQRLRQREALGTLGALSGDPVLGPWGTGEVGRARESATGLAEARRRATEWRPSGTPGIGLRGGRPEMFPGYAEQQRLAHEREMAREGARTANRAAAAEEARRQRIEDARALEEWKLTQPTRTQAGAARKTLSYLPRLNELATELKRVEIPARWEVGAGLAREYLPAGEAAAAAVERTGMKPGAVDWLAKGRQMEQDITRLASGLAVTGFELENLKKWSPWAMGLTNREREQRIQNIYNSLGGEAAAFLNEPWANVKFTQETRVSDEPGAMEATSLPVGTIETDTDTGKQYRFKGGDRYTQENWEEIP